MKKKLSDLAAALLGKKDPPPEAGAQTARPAPETAEDLIRFWDEEAEPPYQITLTDVLAVDRNYRRAIDTALLIGFSPDMDICVNYDKSVSRRHCGLLREGDLFYIVNYSQSNGTYLNHRWVTEKTPIADGDVVTMGRVEMRLEIDG